MSKTEIANMYVNKYKNDIFIIGSEADVYYYNEITKLWICSTREAYTSFVANVFQQTADNLQKTLKKLIKEMDEDDEDDDKLSKLKKSIKTLVKELDSQSFHDTIIKRSTGLLQNNEFIKRLNTKADYLPILNGKKINLATLEISDR
eukprot:gene17971-25148_t